MTDIYNVSTNVTDIAQVMVAAKTDTGIPLGEMFLLAIFVVAFIALKRYEAAKAFSASVVITFLSSVLFWLIGFVGQESVTIMVLLMALSVIILHFNRET